MNFATVKTPDLFPNRGFTRYVLKLTTYMMNGSEQLISGE